MRGLTYPVRWENDDWESRIRSILGMAVPIVVDATSSPYFVTRHGDFGSIEHNLRAEWKLQRTATSNPRRCVGRAQGVARTEGSKRWLTARCYSLQFLPQRGAHLYLAREVRSPGPAHRHGEPTRRWWTTHTWIGLKVRQPKCCDIARGCRGLAENRSLCSSLFCESAFPGGTGGKTYLS